MDRRIWLSWMALVALVYPLLAACNSPDPPLHESNALLQVRAGEWQGKTEFGTFGFQVCPGGKKITRYMLDYQVGLVSATLLSEENKEVLIEPDGSFDLSMPDRGVVFRGQFSEDNRQASGEWQMTMAEGEALQAEWAIER
jgi:hypothetical protein